MSYRSPLILLTVLTLLVSFNYISAWTIPGSNPPAGSVSAPVNTGSLTQTKTGALGVTELVSNDVTASNYMVVNGLTPSADLIMDVNGKIGATHYCNENGLDCIPQSSLASGIRGFGGMFSRNTDDSCNLSYTNYVTGGCSCPSGYTAAMVANTGTLKIFYCAPTT